MATRQTKPKDIVLTIQGGALVDVKGLPKGRRLVIRDYDIEEEGEYTRRDKDGDLYQRIVWGQ